MNNDQTVEKLKDMRLTAMAELHMEHLRSNRTGKMTPDEYLALLIDHQWEDRQNRKIQRLLKTAAFKQKASMADVDYAQNRNLEKNMFERLATLDFIKRRENIILTGASGVGKSYLAQALGHQACMMEHRTVYLNTARILKRLKLAKVDGTYLKELHRLTRADLLILDDFGLQAFDNHAREALMDIIDDRHERTSTIIASQIPVSAWYDIIGEGTIADAILDRMVNSSHRVDLKGESLRKGKLNNV
ncbi:IS21-like element helper ATPase IstB [Allomuricauda taeanensis]|uniref:IS21-like element helper ATPase IstB n=1 Tax=Flagellimonas taeanensis TaxID=1005926 RepID=UPI002E7BA215|nr:IS21-like element helper ATPase IstB [Allomuricauda taeanensis]MEE1964652.1 IS21-like element helper ATPase IstB [Allomuricauda taeanensis]